MLHSPSPIALWCLVGPAGLLVKREAIESLDRSGWTLPRLAPATDSLGETRKAIDRLLGDLGINSIRKPLVSLGQVFEGEGRLARPVDLWALALPESDGTPLLAPFWLLNLASARPSSEMGGDGRGMAVEALIWAGAHLFFSRPDSQGRPRDYEFFASLALHELTDDYFNYWFPEASRDFESNGLKVEIDVSEPHQQILRIHGRAALLGSEIYLLRARVLDLARHARGRLWVTEIIDGQESVQDFADPAVVRQLQPARMSS